MGTDAAATFWGHSSSAITEGHYIEPGRTVDLTPAGHLERVLRPERPDGALLAMAPAAGEADVLAMADEDPDVDAVMQRTPGAVVLIHTTGVTCTFALSGLFAVSSSRPLCRPRSSGRDQTARIRKLQPPADRLSPAPARNFDTSKASMPTASLCAAIARLPQGREIAAPVIGASLEQVAPRRGGTSLAATAELGNCRPVRSRPQQCD